jgi:methanogenic corrinoid protein MtbC1
MNATRLSIGAVEHETGLTKDTLRKWEIRYDFPKPARNPNGERYYSKPDLDRLLIVKRLLDGGMRPALVVPLSLRKLNLLAAEQSVPAAFGPHGEFLKNAWKELAAPAPAALRSLLERALAVHGLSEFVLAIIPQLNQMVGDGWATGAIAVHQEHLYSEVVRNLLLESLGRLRPLPGMPKVLLSTPPEERHDLGILMLHSMLAVAGADCISLGSETPATELVAAASMHEVRIVAISFSIAFPSRRIAPFLEQLRASLPESIQLWAGGGGTDGLRRKLSGVRTFPNLKSAAEALTELSLNGSVTA